jgi:hypothetical protein
LNLPESVHFTCNGHSANNLFRISSNDKEHGYQLNGLATNTLPPIASYNAPPRTAPLPLSQYLSSLLTAAAILGLATEPLALTLLFQHPKPISQAAQHKLAKKTQGLE